MQTLPFQDFLVLQSAEGGKKIDLAESKGWYNYKLDYSTALFSKKPLIVWFDNNKRSVVSGYAVSDGKLYKAHIHSNLMNKALQNDLVGMFCGVMYINGKLYFENDIFGQIPMFYFSNYNFTIVSNRLHLLSIFLKDAGIKKKVNVDVLLRGIYFWGYFFNSYATSNEMILDGCYQVEVNQRIRVSNGKIQIEKKGFFDKANVAEASYEKSLEEGANELSGYFRAVVSNPDINRTVLDVSGGKDSRVVLAAALANRDYLDKVETITYRTHHPLDYEIGLAIVEYFGLNSTVEQSFLPKIPISLSDALAIRRSFFIGTYNLLAASSLSSYGLNICDSRLTGLTANVLRSGGTETIQHYIPELSSLGLDSFYKKLFDMFGFHKYYEKNVGNRVFEYMIGTFDRLPGSCVAEKLEYLHFSSYAVSG